MRTPQTARLACAIALALAGQAYAATAVTTSSSGARAAAVSGTSTGTAVTGTNNNLIRSSTAIPTPANAPPATITGNPGTTTGTNTFTQPPNATNVDVRNQQTQQAVAGTHASGSTSALGPLATGNASVNSPTTAGTGTTSGLGATGTGSSTGNANGTSGTGTTGTTGTTNTNAAAGVPFAVAPIYSNPSDATAGVETNAGNVMANGLASNDVYAGAATAADTTSAANGVNVTRAINQVSRDRKRVGRNGQLLYSIAPRTNGVDRTNQMPDDGPSPALTGSNSTLTR